MTQDIKHVYQYVKIRRDDMKHTSPAGKTLWVPSTRAAAWFIEGLIAGIIIAVVVISLVMR